MGFFDDDPFDSIVREFFGPSRIKRREYVRENEERIVDFIEDENKIYLVFELPGYNEKDVSIVVDGRNLVITAKKSDKDTIQDYLHSKLRQGIKLTKHLPNFVDINNFSYSMKNGILEIVFNKLS